MTAWAPRPPAPQTPAASAGRTCAVAVIAAHEVETASGMMAACSNGRSSGMATSVVAVASVYSAQPPS
jgi:hypothetical protein